MAPEALARRVTALLLVCGCLMSCSRASDVTATWNIEPAPPIAGADTVVRIRLEHEDGSAVRGARLKLEGHMSHPGMAPVVGNVTERENGAYEARIHLSMAGDWVFVLTGELTNGTRVTKHIPVPSVRPAG